MNQKEVIQLTASQEHAMNKLRHFMAEDAPQVFILVGYAGTGKTTLIRQFINELSEHNKQFFLLASTGRAAKILSDVTGANATTIHSHIYKFEDFNQDIDDMLKKREESPVDETGQLLLNFSMRSVDDESDVVHRYYIVDEASMISDSRSKYAEQAQFGSGKLLHDLLKYDPNGKFVFVGDSCQLPPIEQDFSPALTPSYFTEQYGLSAEVAELTQIMRQKDGNDIAVAAAKVRAQMLNIEEQLKELPASQRASQAILINSKWTKFPLRGYNHIHIVPSSLDLYSLYIEDIKKHGYTDATLLCYSNKQCGTLAQIVRPQIGNMSAQIQPHDLLLVTQNNILSGLRNGDQVEVVEVLSRERKAGLTFAKVTVRELFTGKTCQQFLIEEILYSNQTNLKQTQQKELFVEFFLRMRAQHIPQKSKAFKDNLMSDPYLNALRCVYGFALTCHKAQGGEWERVYLEIPTSISAPNQSAFKALQWVYTAITRAKKELYVVDSYNLVR